MKQRRFYYRWPALLAIAMMLPGIIAHGQLSPVHLADPNLQAAVRHELQLFPHEPITKEDMLRLEHLYADLHGITELTGLEHATNLVSLSLWGNNFAELTPIANLRGLTYLDIAGCAISDISPLSNLISLISLNARRNRIVDITPLANLPNLEELRLNANRITDVTPLARLTRLKFLEIHHNQIDDHSPLNALSLSHFIYDQTCDMPPLPLDPRLENRTYPSIFARWSGLGWPPISNRPELSNIENLARHDLRFSTRVFGLDFREGTNGFTISGNIDPAIGLRDELLALNPNMIHLFDVRSRGVPLDTFPADSPYWIRDEHGNIFREVRQGEPVGHGLLDFTHPAVQDRIVQQAVAVSKCGLYDGIMFDYWSDSSRVLGGWDGTRRRFFRPLEEELHAREIIVQRIRAETRPNFLIMGNTNDRVLPRTGPYINGGFMETTIPADNAAESIEEGLARVERSLHWLDQNLREPRINGLEGWAVPTEPADSPANRRWMRALTTLSLTHSDGYVVFTEPEKWTHYWYDFWDADLGRPVGPKAALYDENTPGLYIREFTNGWAVYNHSGEAQVVTLPEEAQGVASGLVNTEHALPNLDGEMYLRVTPKNPADVNGDGVVNILDLTLVAQGFGSNGLEADVNGDGVVNVFDLVFVANQF